MRGKRFVSARAALLLAVLPGLVGIGLSRWPPAEGLERFGLDLLFEARGALEAPAGVCVVAIDDGSYSTLDVDPAGPWPRGLHAELIRTLAREGARAIAFDVLFESERDPEQDAALAGAIRDAGIVVLGSSVEQTDDPRFRETRLVEPHELFANSAAAVARVNLPLDRDGVVRTVWLFPEGQPSLALAAYETATDDRSLRRGGSRIIDYYGGPRRVPTVSVYQALDPGQYLPPGYFRDRIVFVGISQSAAGGPAAKDAFLTPYRGGTGAQTYGVEIHATIAANLLEGRRIGLLPAVAEALLLIALPVVASLAFMALGPLRGALALLGFELLPWIAGHLAFTNGGIWLPTVIPAAIQLPAAYLSSLLWYYLTTVREREKIRRAFSFYLSPEMIGKIADDPGSLQLGGEEILGTAMMTDLQGFTTIAEKLEPRQTAAMLNEYFSEVTRYVFDTGGTLIKFIGDAVFAIWGAPVHVEDHAARACRSALAMARSQEGAVAPAGQALVTRIGVHTGPMVVGNLGSSQRFDYTAIGDAVNLAARLEGLNKAIGTRVIVSASTLAAAESGFSTRPLGRIRVVGRSEPVEIHELLAEAGQPTRPDAASLRRFADALEAFRGGRLDAASDGFREVLDACGGADGPSRFYLGRIERLRAEGIAPDPDGVVTFDSK